ncbi:S-adenosyl-L-methionine-dependent methyltransferase [Apodospora peruviana]|uniref:DNA (cytosine-5-)-methyltransferase n=1 Tax=Apodospora peruviana TaxID=516989 RepID=A0AAE0IBB5_9PEZI|nr:S-adenosyl-L-methionine-dependent methyltransferase [Apodospora peruviana]
MGWAQMGLTKGKPISVELPSSPLVYPKSQYDGFTPPIPRVRETTAVAALIKALECEGDIDGHDFIEFELDHFTFYVDSKLYPCEMRPLHHWATKMAHDKFYFDGILSYGNIRHYVSKVEVSELPPGNYGTSNHGIEDQIWVCSTVDVGKEIYYRLQNPAAEYHRFYGPFHWVVDLAKHVVDFCASRIKRGRQVSIADFKGSFIRWLRKMHGHAPGHRSDDYRTSVVANIEFIWKEANGVLQPQAGKAASLFLFQETMYSNRYEREPSPPVPMIVAGNQSVRPTIVTKYINECFGHMVLGKCCGSRVRRRTVQRYTREMTECIKVGDTISTARDEESSTNTKWKSIASKDSVDDHRWFGLVQRVHISKSGSRSFDVTWFYRPVETPCCMMKYPWPNELFLSDHCTCEDGARSRVKEGEVIGTHSIDWFGSPSRLDGEFFVRQTYVAEERRWVTLTKDHLRCSHGCPPLGFKGGHTVLASLASPSSSNNVAQAFEVVKVFKQDEKRFVRLRRLLQRKQVDPRAFNAPPNELVYTDQLVVVKPDKILGKCFVSFFEHGTPIPSPYNRGGTGFNPENHQFTKLRGLDLFCGSGNFGRGLEDGGVVEMQWANDIWDKAIHTYMANVPDPAATHPFLGSVDDLLQLAMEGKFSANVPRPGEVDFISAGSPCPGFSTLTADKTTLPQIKKQSLVASFASFVDFYRPKYGILENVCGIVRIGPKRTDDMLSQLFGAIVGMGYQAQLVLGDAWSHGAPQCRSRVFLYFAAPGLRLPEAPVPSHSHFPGTKSRGLGEMCNQEPFVRRTFNPTPFSFVTAERATADLPVIDNAKADTCVPFPDHRVALGAPLRSRAQIACIPIHPIGMNFRRSWKGGNGVMTLGDHKLFPSQSHRTTSIATGWVRVRPNSIFPTVTTRSQPTDARGGAGMHWNQDRWLTVQEVRRAQGFLDHEVLLGSPTYQWKLVGNSVARPMAMALGLKFREAWLGSLYDDAGASRAVSMSIRSITPAETHIRKAVNSRESTAPISRLQSQTSGSTRQARHSPKFSGCKGLVYRWFIYNALYRFKQVCILDTLWSLFAGAIPDGSIKLRFHFRVGIVSLAGLGGEKMKPKHLGNSALDR